MIVWLPRTDAGAHPTPYPTLATAATITASVPVEGRGKSTRPIADGEAPRSSDDPSSYFDWWPTRGSAAEWVEMTFAKPATISEASVYWFDDTGHGSVRVPAIVAAPLQGRGRLEAGRGGRGLRRRARSLQPRVVQAGHDGRLADRGDHAADVLGRPPGVDGEVSVSRERRRDCYKVMSPRRTASRTAPVRL